MEPSFFKTPEEFRAWLQHNHATQTELLVGFYKTNSGKPSITWPQSVNQALCFGWIDGVRKNVSEDSYSIRFTPRKPKSIWSAVNIKKIAELTEQGLMQPAGIAAYAKREEKRSGIYSFENEEMQFSPAYMKMFKANKTAWGFFEAQAPWYKKLWRHRVMSAKQEKTQLSRLEKLIGLCAEGKKEN